MRSKNPHHLDPLTGQQLNPRGISLVYDSGRLGDLHHLPHSFKNLPPEQRKCHHHIYMLSVVVYSNRSVQGSHHKCNHVRTTIEYICCYRIRKQRIPNSKKKKLYNRNSKKKTIFIYTYTVVLSG